ncbi:hypothetical protein [Wolbachia endosymbiont (group A) of Rhinocyllus conicus]|uniref:hypothetical protein n=1 Tax=Wolbachia endosymbiont (group A) of Rhinocyllus conicus TaxID=2954053 RepID=UPI002227D8FE|nr:hypothetical protein [Wolbachia endosymbiont (group A) of Rhinocyllus conicus]
MLRDTANESRYDDLRQYDGSRRYDVGLLSSRCLLAGWLCCIATYERLTIARIISNLLKILFFCNQSDQI